MAKNATEFEYECLDSLDEEISAIYGASFDGSDRSSHDDNGADEEIDGEPPADPEEKAEFWKSQENLLQEILSRTNSSGSKLRREVIRAVKMAKENTECHCQKPSMSKCATCLRQAVIDRLQTVGYDAALCTSTWRSNREIPGGRHEYIDVIIHTTDQKKEARFVVELEFRAEFEMAKACESYQNLTNKLPESYVGKPEHLNALLHVVCGACKRSMKDRKIHMGPWRKRKFMKMKWAGSQRRWLSDSPVGPVRSKEVLTPVLTFQLFFPAVEVA